MTGIRLVVTLAFVLFVLTDANPAPKKSGSPKESHHVNLTGSTHVRPWTLNTADIKNFTRPTTRWRPTHRGRGSISQNIGSWANISVSWNVPSGSYNSSNNAVLAFLTQAPNFSGLLKNITIPNVNIKPPVLAFNTSNLFSSPISLNNISIPGLNGIKVPVIGVPASFLNMSGNSIIPLAVIDPNLLKSLNFTPSAIPNLGAISLNNLNISSWNPAVPKFPKLGNYSLPNFVAPNLANYFPNFAAPNISNYFPKFPSFPNMPNFGNMSGMPNFGNMSGFPNFGNMSGFPNFGNLSGFPNFWPPNFAAPNMSNYFPNFPPIPSFNMSGLPGFGLPNFAAPNVSNFIPKFPSFSSNISGLPSFGFPNFAAPNVSNFIPKFPSFSPNISGLPSFAFPNFSAPNVSSFIPKFPSFAPNISGLPNFGNFIPNFAAPNISSFVPKFPSFTPNISGIPNFGSFIPNVAAPNISLPNLGNLVPNISSIPNLGNLIPKMPNNTGNPFNPLNISLPNISDVLNLKIPNLLPAIPSLNLSGLGSVPSLPNANSYFQNLANMFNKSVHVSVTFN